LLAEPGQYGLSSTETLVKQVFRFLSLTHIQIPPCLKHELPDVSFAATPALEKLHSALPDGLASSAIPILARYKDISIKNKSQDLTS
jgi:hypothetical protein